jgi:hypothetical protein
MTTLQKPCSYRFGPFDPNFPQSDELGGHVIAGEIDGYEGFHRDGFVYRNNRRHHHWCVRPFPPAGEERISVTRLWPSRLDDPACLQQLVQRCAAAMVRSWKSIQGQLLVFETAGILAVNHREKDAAITSGSLSYSVVRRHGSPGEADGLSYEGDSTVTQSLPIYPSEGVDGVWFLPNR